MKGAEKVNRLVDAKHDQRPRRGAWAPGDYFHHSCVDCGESFIGDKRAHECADCAYGKLSPVPLSERDTLADVMIRIRKHTGMAQKALAAKLGVTPQYICDLEKSRRLGSVEIVEAAIRKIAMEVGKQVVDHIERMHPDMVAGARSWKSSRLSIRNCAYNAIIAAVNAADRGQDEKFVADNEKHRRVLKRIRRAKSIDEIIAASRSE